MQKNWGKFSILYLYYNLCISKTNISYCFFYFYKKALNHSVLLY